MDKQTEGLQPRLSVIIPTYNRADVLKTALEALERQSVGLDVFEIIVCDDGSTDHTQDVLARFAAETKRPFLRVKQANGGANRARNTAIRQASGQLLLILNDDTICVREFVAEHLKVHDEQPQETTAVLGRMTIAPELPHSPFAALHHDASFNLLKDREILGWEFFFTCNVSVHRSLVERAGGFEERLRWHEDIELGERLARLDMVLHYRPQALGYHLHFLTEADYLKIAAREGESLVLWAEKRPDLMAKFEEIGLTGPYPFKRETRHKVADALMPEWSMTLWIWLARLVVGLDEGAGQKLYARIFQRLKRIAVARTFARNSVPMTSTRAI